MSVLCVLPQLFAFSCIIFHSAGIRKKQSDVEAPPSPTRHQAPSAAATMGMSAAAASYTAKQKQQHHQPEHIVRDPAPANDFYGSSAYNGYDAPAYNSSNDRYRDEPPYSSSSERYRDTAVVRDREYDRDRYDRADDRAYSDYNGRGTYQAPPPARSQPPKVPVSRKSRMDSVNYKRMFYALLLMLLLAAIGIGIWAAVTYGRKGGSGPAAPATAPSNFTMNLSAGGKNSAGQLENCTTWFNNKTVSGVAGGVAGAAAASCMQCVCKCLC